MLISKHSYYGLGLKGQHGVDLQDAWAEEIHTNLGLLISDFPNLFMVFGPQCTFQGAPVVHQHRALLISVLPAPTTLYNGPTTVECQSDLVTDLITEAEEKGAKWVETTKAAEQEWARLLEIQFKQSLVQYTPSWWTRANVPGAKVQPLTYLGGIMEYEKLCRAAIEGDRAGLMYQPIQEDHTMSLDC